MGQGSQQEHRRLFSGLRSVSLLTLVSRVLGLIRDIGMATLFGNGMILDAFTIAFRIPNLARRLFGEGALSTAFIPVFVRESHESGRDAAWRLASAVLTVLAASLTGAVLVGEVVLWRLPAWVDCGYEARLLIGLTAVMLPYLLLICLAAQIGALLNALGHFTWPAALPVLLNLGWIAAIVLLPGYFSTPQSQIYALCVVIVALGCIQLVAPWSTLKRFGFRYQFDWSGTRRQVADIVRIMLPIVVGLSITQLNTLCDSLIAWSFSRPESTVASADTASATAFPLASGTASALFFGQRMYQFPLGVFGVALGTVLFPLLARHAARGEMARLRDDLMLGIRLVLVVGIPASAGLLILARPITSLFFQHGAFDAEDARQTSQMIAAYGTGVWAYCGLLIVHRGYYAIGDRMTPVRVGTAAVLVNLTLNLTLIWFVGGIGLALSTSVCAILQLAVVGWLLQHRLGRLDWPALASVAGRAVLATAIMSAVCLATLYGIGPSGSLVSRAARVVAPFTLSVVAYLGTAHLLRLKDLWLLFRRP